jgi:hypothetical protein
MRTTNCLEQHPSYGMMCRKTLLSSWVCTLGIGLLVMLVAAPSIAFQHSNPISRLSHRPVSGCPIDDSGSGLAEVAIGYGETLTAQAMGVDANTSWRITKIPEGKVISAGWGESLYNFHFSTPGSYFVDFAEDRVKHNAGTCEHSQGPDRIRVNVGAARMEFDLDGLKFTHPIIGGKPTEDIMLRVPVEVRVHEGAAVEYKVPEVRSAGIGTTIVARPVLPVMVLSSGRTVMEYKLSGQAERGSYIMFDLVDINGRVIGYPYKDMIR